MEINFILIISVSKNKDVIGNFISLSNKYDWEQLEFMEKTVEGRRNGLVCRADRNLGYAARTSRIFWSARNSKFISRPSKISASIRSTKIIQW